MAIWKGNNPRNRGRNLTMVINHLLNGMILRGGWSRGNLQLWSLMVTPRYPSVGQHSWLENPSHLDRSSTRNMYGGFPSSYASLPEFFLSGGQPYPWLPHMVYLPIFTYIYLPYMDPMGCHMSLMVLHLIYLSGNGITWSLQHHWNQKEFFVRFTLCLGWTIVTLGHHHLLCIWYLFPSTITGKVWTQVISRCWTTSICFTEIFFWGKNKNLQERTTPP